MIPTWSNTEPPRDYIEGAIFTVNLGTLVKSGFDLGLNEYPIFEEKYRASLNAKIIEHYFFREIGLETPQLFKRFLNRKMSEIMPFYNDLYKTTIGDFQKANPLLNIDMITTESSKASHEEDRNIERSDSATSTTSSESASTTDTKGRTVNSTTPQMPLSGREDYASSLVDSAQDATTSTNGSDTVKDDRASTDDMIMNATDTANTERSTKGLTGVTFAAALAEFRGTILNIDMMIIEELNELFMSIYTDYVNVF